ncbi:sugar phosphate isomerase/epimerase [Pseudomonas sp. Tn43]|uniref:sugar phosphate isomerase/epimerase family protein n=1 Tax=Pseudomonas sp. Tn43 TaxID=701213 RepID=UPI00160B8DF2|nr:sugar phosphate isomerase/epimerase family protein [Pseudomonas sp. Tn43]MBB3240139.1 sugar phosphate isomerase/epimerase [Pseudomonas sp. Tn43]
MIISTFSYLWSSTAIDAIAQLAEHGHRVFEVPVSSPHCWPVEISTAERSAVSLRLHEYGAKIRSLNAGGYDINLASPAANMRHKSIEHIKSVIDLAAVWGTQEVVISPGTRRPMISPPLEKTYDWMYESLAVLIPMAKQAGVRLLLENTPYCFTPTMPELAEVVSTLNDEVVRVVYDIANAAYIGEDPVASLLAYHASIDFVHVSDTGTDVWGHDPVGTGVVDFIGLGEAVHATCGIENCVLEIIREENALYELNKGVQDLRAKGWKIP